MEARAVKTVRLLGPLTKSEHKHVGPTLWVEGEVALAEAPARVAVVGSREASDLGLRRAAKAASALAGAGVVIVSGLARGIDVAAHRACLAVGGRTLAVIATPIDRCYPPEHAQLQRVLAREQLVVSPFEPGHATEKADFVRRNRVMALFVHASIVVEAGDGSGTKSHALELLRLGKPLFIMRSQLERSDVRWPRQAIERGAIVLDGVDQVLAMLALQFAPSE